MKLLALDSSGLVASVAVAEDDNLIGEYTVNYKKTHSQTLLPMLDEVAKMAARCEMINPDNKPAPQELQDKHYYRKHGANAYYGQN